MTATVYLCGAINNFEDAGRIHDQIRTAAREYADLDFDWIDPLDFEVNLDDPEDVVKTDLAAVERVDALFVYYVPGVESWGTPMEVKHAGEVGTPVVTYQTDETDRSPWLDYWGGHITRDLQDALSALSNVLPDDV